MKAVILAGGYGTRISEESHLKPKPMIEIGGKPILWHILKIYSHYGINDFVICCGYKGYMIKEYFANYSLHKSNITFDLEKNKIETHSTEVEPWRITLVDTGLNTMTGGRLKRVEKFLDNETFPRIKTSGYKRIERINNRKEKARDGPRRIMRINLRMKLGRSNNFIISIV